MAKIEDLIAQIPDERLRKGVAEEVKALKKTKRFGLVFEEHLPETVRLPKLPVKVGELVGLKKEPGNRLWRVKEIHKGVASCERAVEGYPDANDRKKEFRVLDLVVVRSFGDPIYPALVPVDRVGRGGADKPWHLLINADNFHALQLLLYAYEGKVDVIYIDPPYNSGARDWKYNNDYVDKADSFRHSKWLSMIKRRLLLAKRLLARDGVLIVTIDENEVHHLSCLLEEVFPGEVLQQATIVINPKGVTQGRFSRVEEFALFLFRPGAMPAGKADDLLTPEPDEGFEAKKTFTFWQTVANTIAAAPADFILIIDEAHRGAGVSEKSRKPIMQKFITGSEADGLPAVPLVLGMSATPQRFTELLGNTTRTQRPVNIIPEMVRFSGLLKDLIVVTTNKSESVQSDLTHLQNAAERWMHFRQRWESYCTKEKEKEAVKPVLVVQVQDGTDVKLTLTPLDDVVQVIQRVTGPLGVNEVVHCFQDREEISFGGCIIRRMDASRIQDSTEVKVVLFKTALTTGWDCPRAEVMMSFRKSVDATTIAQLVGRMIRTPLARRIESDEVLNTVDLFLPHYDKENLDRVLEALRSPDAHDGLPTEVVTQAVEYPRNEKFADVFEHLATLKTFSIDRAPKMSDLKRALRLSGLLMHEGIDEDADGKLRQTLIERLAGLRDGYAKTIPDWSDTVREGGEIEVDVTAVAIGAMNVTGRNTARMELSVENIDHLFEEAGRVLAAGEGLHRSYWKRYQDKTKPNECKLELFAITRQGGTAALMEKLAASEFKRMWDAHAAHISKLPAADRARFQQLKLASGTPVEHEWILPDQIIEKPGQFVWREHLYADARGEFATNLNGWEKAFLSWTQAQQDFVCWLRNSARRDWAFCVPYEKGGEKGFYPDFVIVRKQGKSYIVDVLEPHDDTRTDTWAKVKGLAKFADTHGTAFGRLMVGRTVGEKLEVVDVADHRIREKARKMGAPGDLECLFGEV